MPARAVDLVEAVEDALARLPCDLRVATTLWAPFPATVAATPAELAIVLDNVLANARRHACSVVHVSVVPAGRRVRLLVDDDGPGIPAERRRAVFDPFVTTKDGGTGLGLTMAREAAVELGGFLELEDTPSGASFALFLPVVRRSAEEATR